MGLASKCSIFKLPESGVKISKLKIFDMRLFTAHTWILGFPERTALWEIAAQTYFWNNKQMIHTRIGVEHFIYLNYWRKTSSDSLKMDPYFYKTGSRYVPKFPTMQCVPENLRSTYCSCSQLLKMSGEYFFAFGIRGPFYNFFLEWIQFWKKIWETNISFQ